VHKYEELKLQCTELCKEGKFVMVRKSNGSIRVCIDYQAINERTVKYMFPLLRIDDFNDRLRLVTNCVTHLDLRPACNWVKMSDDGQICDSIVATTSQGLAPNGDSCLLEGLVMKFGLCNA